MFLDDVNLQILRYANGISMRKLAKILGLSRTTMWRRLVTLRSSGLIDLAYAHVPDEKGRPITVINRTRDGDELLDLLDSVRIRATLTEKYVEETAERVRNTEKISQVADVWRLFSNFEALANRLKGAKVE